MQAVRKLPAGILRVEGETMKTEAEIRDILALLQQKQDQAWEIRDDRAVVRYGAMKTALRWVLGEKEC